MIMDTRTHSIAYAQRVREAISADTSRTTLPVLSALFKTLVLPLIVFVITMLVSGYMRVYFDMEFQDSTLNTLTAISTSLLILVFTWFAFRWSQARFGGLSAFSEMIRVVGSVRALELAVANAGDQDAESLTMLRQSADDAWQTYKDFVAHLGLKPPSDSDLNAVYPSPEN